MKSIFIFLLFSLIPNLFAQNKESLSIQINDLVFQELNINFERTPCFIVGIIQNDSTYIFPFGSIIKDSVQLPTPDILFEIGHLTNLFTASLVHSLVKQNLLSYNSSINKYLPESLFNKNAEFITINHLLTHTSGLPRLPIGIGRFEKEDNQPFAYYPKENLKGYYKSFLFEEEDLGKYSFSDIGYALLELIIEEVTKQSFREVLKSELNKWGLKNTVFQLNETNQDKLVQGFDKAYNPVEARKYTSFEAAVGLKSTMDDLLQFLKININSEKFDELHSKQYPTGIRKNTSIGKGWHIVEQKKYPPVILHIGTTSGYRASISFIKETGTGVIVLSNSEYALKGLGYLLLEKMNNGFKRKRKF